MTNLIETIDRTYKDRPTMDAVMKDPVTVFLRLLCEVDEAKDEMNRYLDGKSTTEAVAEELADVMVLLLATFRAIGEDPQTHTKNKIGKLVMKYPVKLFSNGLSYTEACVQVKKNWKDEFYEGIQ